MTAKDPRDPHRYLLFGTGSVGKSLFCWKAVHEVGEEKCIVFDTEDRWHTYPCHAYTTKEPWGVLTEIEIRPSKIIEILEAANRKGGYKLIVIDGLSDTELMNMENIERESKNSDPRSWWGVEKGDVLSVQIEIRRLRAKGADIIITCHEKTDDHPTKTVVEGKHVVPLRWKVPGMAGYWGDHIVHYNEFVGYMTREIGNVGGKQVFISRLHMRPPSAKVFIKNDWEYLGCRAYLDNPGLKQLKEALLGASVIKKGETVVADENGGKQVE